MSEKQIPSGPAGDLRRRAEEIIRADKATTKEALSSDEARRVLHELQVHQIELEMENEELRRMREELEASQSRYFDLFNLAPVGYFTLSEQGLILEANLTFAGLLGVARGDLINRPLVCFIAGEDHDVFERFCEQLWATGARRILELRMERADSARIWARLEATVVQDRQSGSRAWRSVVSDITERKQIDDAQSFLLQCGYPRFRGDFYQLLAPYLAQSLGMDYVCIDRLQGDGLIAQTVAVYSEGKFEDNVTYALKDTPCGDVVGKRICCFPKGVRHLFPRDVVLQDMKAESYVGVTLWSSDGKPIGLIAIIGRKPLANPRLAESVLQVVAVRAAGELERKQAQEDLRSREEEFRLILEHSSDAIFWADAETGILIRCNRKAEELTERTRDELIGMHQRHLHPPDPRYTKMFRKAAAVPTAENIEAVILSRTGKETPVVVNSSVVTIGQRRIIQGIFRDVSELKQAREALQRAHDELELRVEQRTRELTEAVARLEAEVGARLRTEAELRESEERYRTLFAAAPVGIAITDPAGRVHDANAALCAMLGVTLPEAQASRAGSFYVKPSDRRQLLNRVRQVTRVEDFETGLRRKDGTQFPASIQLNWIQVHQRQFYLTIVQDLTRRRRAERHVQGIAALHEAFVTEGTRDDYLQAVVQLLRRWTSCACAGIRLVDREGRLPFVASVGFTHTFRKEEGQVCPESGPCPCLRVLKGRWGPDEAPFAKGGGAIFCNDLRDLLGRLTAEGEELAGFPCAKAGYGSVAHAPIRYRGRVIGALQLADRQEGKFLLDTTEFLDSSASLVGEALHRFGLESELRESEVRFRAMFQRHQAVMLLVEPQLGAIVDANEAAERFYGYPHARLTTMSIRDLSIWPLRPAGRRPPHAPRELRKNAVFAHRLANGEIRTVEAHSSPIVLGEQTLMFSIIHDITERRRLEREVLEVGDRERQRIGWDLHDSLGGGLSGLAMLSKGLAQTLARSSRKEAAIAKEILQGIKEAVSQTRAIARGLCPVGLSAFGLINGLEELARSVKKRHGVSCQVRAPQAVSIQEDLVASHLYQIVAEAVHNAARHSKARRIEIAVNRQKTRLLVSVWDDGRGLPNDIANAPGMGLRTMQYRAEVIGATLEIYPSEKGGTVVSCVLPTEGLDRGAAAPAPPRT